MATYRITSRRRKGQSDTAPAQSASFSDPAAQAGGQNAPIDLFETFFGEKKSPAAVETANGPDTPAGEDARPVRIDPASEEPTVEFDAARLREIAEAAAERDVDTAPAESDADTAKPTDDLQSFFANLFGTDSAAKQSAQPSTLSAPAVTPPAAGLGGETIRIPTAPLSAPAEEHYDPTQSATPTRATIQDLIRETKEEVQAPEKVAEAQSFDRPEDADGLLVELRARRGRLWRRFAALAVLFCLTLYLESATFGLGPVLLRPEFLTPGRFGIVFLLCDLQLIVLAAAAASKSVFSGARTLFSGKAGEDSVVFTALLVALLHPLFLLLTARTAENYVLFGSVAVFLALLGVCRALLENSSDRTALLILMDDKVKFAAAKSTDPAQEFEAFAEHIGEDAPEVFSVQRTNFVDGFSERTESEGHTGASFSIGIAVSILASAGIALWCYLGGTRDAVLSVGAFVCAMMMSLPACSLFSTTLPFFFAARRGAKTSTALIGESAVEECSSAQIVSFDDTEVFLPKHVKVTSVRTYGAARIDKILIYCAQIFRIVGGPLSYVFENSISSLSVPGVVEILENEGVGICARIDGKEIFVGSAAYMEAYEFPPEINDTDADFERTAGRIMYLAIENELCAKFYIKYAVSARFCAQLKDLNRAGLYAAVKTCDPNVDRALLNQILKSEEYPIGVIKTASAAKNAEPLERLSAPIAGTSKISGVLNGFLLCDAVRQRASLATLNKFVSMLLGLFITFVLSGMQNAYLTPTVCLFYQLLWLVPVVIPSFFDWPSPRSLRKKK